MIRRQVVIVGAGPAGMSAAVALAEAGVATTVLDENPNAGGQIYRQARATGADADAQRGKSLLQRFAACGQQIEFLRQTSVWGIFPERRLAVSQGQGWQMIEAEQLILAPGAYEYTPPFPGWTLPGVMTPGGAQALVKSGILPGRQAVVAGSGPFLLVVAGQLHKAGVKVLAVVEMARRRDVWSRIGGLASHLPLVAEGWRHLRQLRKAGIPLLWGHIVHVARGDRELQQVAVAPCDDEGTPDQDRTKVMAADTLAVGYGFVPRTDLAQSAGCRLRFVEAWGGWVPEVNEDGQTSARGVWVAGDGAGVAGALAAEWQGTLAGLAVARHLGGLDESRHVALRRPIAQELARLRTFRAALDAIYRLRSGLARLANDNTLVCRCEELSCHEVDTGISFGGTDWRTLKVMTRLGMGPCQGRMCWPAMARRIADRTDRSLDSIGPSNWRPPLRPLLVGDLLNEGTMPQNGHPAVAAVPEGGTS